MIGTYFCFRSQPHPHGWSFGTSSHYLLDSHLWLREVVCAHQRPHPGHEQANAVIKDDWGAIGVTEDPSALRRWMIACPEVSHLVAQNEIASEAKETVVYN